MYRNLNQNVSIQIRTRDKSGEEGKEGEGEEVGGGEERGKDRESERTYFHKVQMEMRWLIGSTPDSWCRGPMFESSFSHNAPAG